MTEPPRPPWRRSKRQTVRLACPCGRNLADLRLIGSEPHGELWRPVLDPYGGETGDYEGPLSWTEFVWAFPRPGVRHAEHPHGAGRFTFRWDCRCGRTWEIRRDRIEAIWKEHAKTGSTIRLILGHDAV